MPDPLIAELEWLTRGIRAIRIARFGDTSMALELKGLKAEAVAARAHHARLLAAYRSFNVAAPAHAAEVEGLSEEIGEMSSDLAFAVGLGGNGGGSEADTKAEEKAEEPPAAEQPQPPTAAPAATPSPPVVGQAQPNFHE